jgi:small conductance mechanosensitive channel
MKELIQTINQSLLNLVSHAVQLLPAAIFAIVILILTRFAVKFSRRIVKISCKKFVKSVSLQMLFEQVTSVTIWVIGVLIACTLVFPSLRLGDIIGLLGLGSVAVGFAFQDIFKNFLAGILLLLNEPFRVNDQIIVDDYEGTVESINIRATQIRTYQDERIVIPNAIVFTSAVRVLTHFASRRTDLQIGLDYNTPLPQARQVLLDALDRVDGILPKPAAEVDLIGFGESSIDFVARYWTLPQMAHVRRIRSEVVMALKQACDEADFNIPYPIRTLYFFDQQRFEDHHSINNRTHTRPQPE